MNRLLSYVVMQLTTKIHLRIFNFNIESAAQ